MCCDKALENSQCLAEWFAPMYEEFKMWKGIGLLLCIAMLATVSAFALNNSIQYSYIAEYWRFPLVIISLILFIGANHLIKKRYFTDLK